jgi:hypothetical protein
MNITNRKVLVTSTIKAIDKAKKYGTLDLKLHHIYYLYNHCIEFTNDLITKGFSDYQDINIELKKRIADFRHKHREEICNYRVIMGGQYSPARNLPPSLASFVKDMGIEEVYQFKVGDFTRQFTSSNYSYKKLTIIPDGNTQLFSDAAATVAITDSVEFDLSLDENTLLELYFKRPVEDGFEGEQFKYRISEDTTDLESNIAIATIFSAGEALNQPISSLGDNTVYSTDYSVVLTLDMFTTGLQAPYSDPENDLIDAIRVDDISGANLGVFTLNNVALQVGDIITRENIEAGLFIHYAPAVDAITSDVFEFSARDEGNGLWVN